MNNTQIVLLLSGVSAVIVILFIIGINYFFKMLDKKRELENPPEQ